MSVAKMAPSATKPAKRSRITGIPHKLTQVIRSCTGNLTNPGRPPGLFVDS